MTTRQSGGPGTTNSPAELREDIEATRQQLGATVEALAARADVKAAVRRKVTETRHRAAARASQLKRRAIAWPGQAREQAAGGPGNTQALVAAAAAVAFTVIAIVAWRRR